MANNNILLEGILKQYRENFDELIDENKSFEYFSAEQLLKEENLDEEDIENGLIGNSNDNGIDGFFIILDGEAIYQIEQIENISNFKKLKVYFHQYKNQYKIEENVVLKFSNAFNDILDTSNTELEGWNRELKERIILLRDLIEKTAPHKVEIDFIINHVSKANSENIKNNSSYWSKVKNLKNIIKKEKISTLNVYYDFIGGEELKNLSYRKPDYTIDLILKDSPITLEFGNNHIGYIALVSLKNYYNFIVDESGSIKNYLFDSNVRDYQNKTNVNKEIEKSINENSDIDFWWLNNGITIIAGKDSSQVGKKLFLENVKIVNGLQTSYSIYNSLKNKKLEETLDNRSLFVKIIICDQKDIVDKIIRATNSQNSISSEVLRATDGIQRDIEEYFLSKGYFYDRRKNYYKNLGKSRDKIISINLLSQCIVSMVLPEKNPSKARSNRTILIRKDEDYKNVFDESYSFQVYLNSVLIYKKVDKELKKLISTDEYEDKIEVENFKFHISRILISELTSKGNPIAVDLIDEKIVDKVNSKIIEDSISILEEILDEYRKNNSQTIVNISKQTEFSKFITQTLNKKYKNK